MCEGGGKCVSLLSLLSTRVTSRTVPPIVATKHPLAWTGDRQAHTNGVLPSESKGWTCKACGDRAVCTGCSLHAVGGPHEEFLTMECAPYTIKLAKIPVVASSRSMRVFLFLSAISRDPIRGLTTPSPGTTWVARDRPRSLCKGPALSGSQASASLSPRPVDTRAQNNVSDGVSVGIARGKRAIQCIHKTKACKHDNI